MYSFNDAVGQHKNNEVVLGLRRADNDENAWD
jgi:hypothetical protein